MAEIKLSKEIERQQTKQKHELQMKNSIYIFKCHAVVFAILFLLGSRIYARNEIPNELIIQLRSNTDIKTFLVENASHPLSVSALSTTMNISLLKFTDAAEAKNNLYMFKQLNDVIAVQYNHTLDYRSYTPTDSFYQQQWYLRDTGQYGYLPGTDINVVPVWDSTTGGRTRYGDSIVVAIIDGKFDLHHRDINYFKNYNEIPSNSIDDDGDGYIDNYNGWSAHTLDDNVNLASAGHATQLAGIVGAYHDNKGIAGINDGVKILPIYSAAVESEVFIAYNYVIDQRKIYDLTSGVKGAFIVATNSSFGIDMVYPVDFPIWCAMYDSMGKYGILSAAATTNSATDVDIYGDIPTACASNFLITVTNLTGSNTLHFSAGYGDSTIDIAAPGVNILSCIGSDGYAASNGTSFATPMVAGGIALLMSHACENFLDLYSIYPDSAALLLKKYIIDGATLVPDLAGKTLTGGRLDLFNSLIQLNNFDCSTCNGTIDYEIQNSACANKNTGYIHTKVLPSSTSLQYAWSNGDTTANIDSLSAGTYTLTITDSLGCIRIKRFNIQAPTALVTDSLSNTFYNASHPASIYIKGSGGVSPYQYSIDGISFHSATNYTGLNAGNYTVYIRDANGCLIDTSLVIDDNTSVYELSPLWNISLVNNLSNAEIYLRFNNSKTLVHTIQYQITNMQGQIILSNEIENLNDDSFEKKIDISLMSKGLYLLTIYNEKEKLKTFKFGKY